MGVRGPEDEGEGNLAVVVVASWNTGTVLSATFDRKTTTEHGQNHGRVFSRPGKIDDCAARSSQGKYGEMSEISIRMGKGNGIFEKSKIKVLAF